VEEGKAVTLNGSNSSDPEGGALSYSWEQAGGSVAVNISNATSAQAGFTSPNVDMDGVSLVFRLTVTDETGLMAEDYCTVNVSWVNQPPRADAGADVTVFEGNEVFLDGSNSSDPEKIITSVLWMQISGPEVAISDPTQPVTSFIAPMLTSESASLVFQLVVEDMGGLIDTDTCVVNITWVNEPPAADAGADQTVNSGDTVRLNGSGSTDRNDGFDSIRWSQLSGPAVTLSDPNALAPTFTAPSVQEAQSLSFELTITDKGGLISQDTCLVTVNPCVQRTAPTPDIKVNKSDDTVVINQ
jgi:hypothetical protein